MVKITRRKIILIVAAVLFILTSYLLVAMSQRPRNRLSEAEAISTIKGQYPNLKDYPSNKLPPRSIKTKATKRGWYIAFIQEGSGRPVLSAFCYFINNQKAVTATGSYIPPVAADTNTDFSARTCSPDGIHHKTVVSSGRPQQPHPSIAQATPKPAPQKPSTPSTDAAQMPTGDLPGWHQVLADDFTGNAVDATKWGVYDGQPIGAPAAWWSSSHVVVHNGFAELQTYKDPANSNRWVSGGMSSAPGLKQTYGKYEVRFRADKGKGVALAFLLMPSDNTWPPEIDFAEDDDGTRNPMFSYLHFGVDNTQIEKKVTVDTTQWHTMGVEWTPHHLTYTLDGNPWSSVESANVPSKPMEMDLQAQITEACTDTAPQFCPDSTTPEHVNVQIDWVVAYSRM
jgi:beta-glucanase (GH16 family)